MPRHNPPEGVPVDPMDSLFGDLQGVEALAPAAVAAHVTEETEDTVVLEFDAPGLEMDTFSFEEQTTQVFDTTLLAGVALAAAPAPVVEAEPPVAATPAPPPPMPEPEPEPVEAPSFVAAPEPVRTSEAVAPVLPAPAAEATENNYGAVDDDLIRRALKEVRRRKGAFQEEEPAPPAAPSSPAPTPLAEPGFPAPEGDTGGMPSFTGASNFDIQNKTPHHPFDLLPPLPGTPPKAVAGLEISEDEDDEETEGGFFTLDFDVPEETAAELLSLAEEEPAEEETEAPDEATEEVLLLVIEEEVETEILLEDAGTEAAPPPEADNTAASGVAVTRVNALSGVAAEGLEEVFSDAPPPEDLPDIVDTLSLPLDWNTTDALETAARFIMRHRSPRLRKRISAQTLAGVAIKLLLSLDLNQSQVRSEEELLARLLQQVKEAEEQV